MTTTTSAAGGTEVPTPRAPSEPAAVGSRPPRRRWRWLPRYTWNGTLGALLFGCSSLTPSLLPRGWLLQGLIAGITAALGYGVFVALAWFVAELTATRMSPGFRRRAWQVLAVLGTVLVVVMLVLGARWQKQIHELMGLKAPAGYTAIGIVVVAVLTFALFVQIGRGVRWLGRALVRLFSRFLPRRMARPLGVLVAGALVIFLLNGVLFQGLINAANSAFSVKDDGTEKGAVEPTAPERSGSPASLIPWADLGLQGRNFVGTGPTPDELTAFSGRPALEPVRAYAGLASSDDAGERAALAVRDLQRAGGFDRSVLVVATTTGTGWVDPAASTALEYEFNGDTAMVAMQYSYLPSWLSFLVDQAKARDAGRALFDAVYGVWANLPQGSRPKLYVFGESLGTFGGEAAFSGLADIVNRTDGVLWAGPPNFNDLWRGLVADRESGSPEWRPVVDDGKTARFADEPQDLSQPPGPWSTPRVVYLQNASDPIVWWSPRLIFSHPDWLRGTRGPDVSQSMVWIPFVTFWQVTADMVFAVNVPDGHGHKYSADYANGWADVAQPPNWTDADTQRLRELIG
ncbi:alpha/beta hydrolase [Petropleomorpha daqingensis]|uniref:Putative membrane protein n=1 Tax=Petropleomorpha daqingensis TaxID=2026353 RepID=A0A853CHV7_9ACTN|nr:alpha/beta-hydrolase family protein [Petropleomorpha daqingensis]NYJ07574.1 putative membrane protein [Petropleomorpha daqingensis]